MKQAIDIDKPRHKQAHEWSDELVENLYRMDSAVKESILETAVEFAAEELTTVRRASALQDMQLVEDILTELKEICGEGNR